MKHITMLALAGLSALFLVTPVIAQENPDEQLFLAQELLAKKGRPDAQYYLGEMYEQGLGTTQNLDNAFKWYKSSADKGFRRAKHKMAKQDEIIAQHARDLAEENAAIQAQQQAKQAQQQAKQAQQQAKVETNSNAANTVTAEQAAEAAEKQHQALLSKRAKRQAAVKAMLKKMEGQPEVFD